MSIVRFRALLIHPRFPMHVALIAAALAAPSLGVGWLADDYTHQFAIRAAEDLPDLYSVSPWNPFAFWDGDPAHNRAILDLGVSPWWTHPQIKAVLWRPLAVVFHHLDYALWPDSPFLMHVHSLAWFGAVIAAVAVLYRRIGGATWAAGLAGLLYAIDDAHAVPAAWIANRSTLLATFFGVLSILAHVQWRERGSRRCALFAPMLLALSLLSKEEGLATTAYLFAYAVFLGRGSWRDRLISLAPYAVVVVLWRVVWSMAGGGLEHCRLYVDPMHDPIGFVVNVWLWAPVLLLGQWAFPPPDINVLFTSNGPHPVFWYAAIGLIVIGVWVIGPRLRNDRVSGFFVIGMLLSLLPICAGLPGDRLLYFAGIGAMGLVAKFIESLTRIDLHRPGLPTRSFAAFLILVHGVAASVLLPLRSAWPLGPTSFLRQMEFHAPLGLEIAEQDLILVNAPVVLFTAYLPIKRLLAGEPAPRHLRVLSPSGAAVSLHRPDVSTLIVRPTPSYLGPQFDRLFRRPDESLALGERVALTGVTVEVTEVDDAGRVSEAKFHFDVDLDDPSLRWFRWKKGEFVLFTPPRVGETIELPAAMLKVF